ncbi:MAG TPA: hypothetical protein VH598_09640 [Verrucomicrobiae bacterium]|nr:hypothetical protein [Verrucomicrobiae bacterium]
MTDPEPDKNLEEWIHRRLRGLPELSAPGDIIRANVLRRIAAQQTMPWWKCPWLEWPRGMQVISFALLALALGTAGYFYDDIFAGAHVMTVKFAGTLQALKPIWTVTQSLLGATQVLVGSIKSYFLIIAGLAIAALYLSAVGVGTLCYRVAMARN